MTITLTGENDFARNAELKRLVGEFVKQHGEISLERLDGEDVELARIDEALNSLPFLASQKMVIVKNPGANKQFAEAAEKLLESLPDSTQLILVEPRFDKRSKLYKYLQQKTDFKKFEELTGVGLVTWLTGYAKQFEANLSSSNAKFLVERVGENQQLLAMEIGKLKLLDLDISRANIEKLTEATPQSTIFQLIESAFAGNTQKALKLYAEQRALKVEPQQIIAMLAWQLHVLALMKTAGQRSPEQAAREGGINPYVAKKSAAAARRLSLVQLKVAVSNLLKIDQRLKRESIDADEALKFYFLRLTQ